jgi:hemerythrin-like metal-binding protein
MPLITWNDTIALDIKSIDAQHQRWIGLINDLHDAMRQGKGKGTIEQTLAKVMDYTHTHFATEEKLMLQTGYPDYIVHKVLHDEFAAKVQEWQPRQQAADVTLTLEVMGTLKDWLLNHIQTADRRYAPWFKSKGVQ